MHKQILSNILSRLVFYCHNKDQHVHYYVIFCALDFIDYKLGINVQVEIYSSVLHFKSKSRFSFKYVYVFSCRFFCYYYNTHTYTVYLEKLLLTCLKFNITICNLRKVCNPYIAVIVVQYYAVFYVHNAIWRETRFIINK